METQKILTRDFVLSFFAQFVSSFTFCILIPTFPIFLSRWGSKEAEIGVLVGALSMASLIIRPFVGRALLKIAEKKFMVSGNLLYAVSSAAYLIAPPFWPLLFVRIIQGIGSAVFSTASFTLVANITPEKNRGQILSYFYLSINVAFALAPYFGMLLINHYDFNVLFLVCTGLSLCGLFITLKLGNREIEPPKDTSMKLQDFLSYEALPASIMAFMLNIIWGALTAFFPLYALSQGVTNPGLFFAAFALMLILGRTFGGKILDLYSRDKIMFPCLITYIVAMLILAFSTNLPMFILVAVIWGLAHAFLYPTLVIFAIDRAGPSRGPAIATFTAIGDLGVGLGSLIMGIILQLSSYRIMFLCLVITIALNFLYFYFFVRKKGGNGYAHL
jgi:MFS family permease